MIDSSSIRSTEILIRHSQRGRSFFLKDFTSQMQGLQKDIESLERHRIVNEYRSGNVQGQLRISIMECHSNYFHHLGL